VIPNCCLTISLFYLGEFYNLSMEPVYFENGDLKFYIFSFSYQDGETVVELNFDLTYNDGVWFIQDLDTLTTLYSLETTECPVSQMLDWTFDGDAPTFGDFVINQIDCQGSPGEDSIEDATEETVFNPCKYSNAIIKGKHILAKEVALLSGAEMLGLDSCKKDWNDAIKKYLAIDVLRCAPYNQYTESEERCLIGHLATNNKC